VFEKHDHRGGHEQKDDCRCYEGFKFHGAPDLYVLQPSHSHLTRWRFNRQGMVNTGVISAVMHRVKGEICRNAPYFFDIKAPTG